MAEPLLIPRAALDFESQSGREKIRVLTWFCRFKTTLIVFYALPIIAFAIYGIIVGFYIIYNILHYTDYDNIEFDRSYEQIYGISPKVMYGMYVCYIRDFVTN